MRECQSSVLENIKSRKLWISVQKMEIVLFCVNLVEPYIFTINQYSEREENYPKINLYSSEDGHGLAQCHSHTSSSIFEQDERSKVENENVNVECTSSPMSVVQETKQLLELMTTNDEFDLSRLASEV